MLPIFTIRLHFTQKVVSESHILLHQNCLHIKKRLLKKFEKNYVKSFWSHLNITKFYGGVKPSWDNFLKNQMYSWCAYSFDKIEKEICQLIFV